MQKKWLKGMAAVIFRIFSIILIVCFPFVNTNIVGRYVYNQFHSGSATAPFAHKVTGELSNKIKFILDRPFFQCYNASDEQRRS